jgi:hypothetical protein
MRLLALALVLAGCSPDPAGTNFPGGGGGENLGCTSDTQCGSGLVCARTGDCLESSSIHAIHVTWTVNGAAADATTCTRFPDLEISFGASNGATWGYAPVPCGEGKFSIDKFPVWFNEVELAGAYGAIDRVTGEAMLDLQ